MALEETIPMIALVCGAEVVSENPPLTVKFEGDFWFLVVFY